MGEQSSCSQVLICREEASAIDAPIISSYNDRIRPLLDCVDNLRRLKIMQEGIQLPTIVVVGDQSSGKSSVLESLAGISLPRGQGICTRVPLIMRLQNQPNLATPELQLEFNGKTVPTDEAQIEKSIIEATEEIAGHGKGISHTPLTLAVKKNGVPDLTMVDLPGITRVPVHGQPEDIYEQISNIIMEYITPEESIILNVLSAASDFTTNESIRMSQKVDKTGKGLSLSLPRPIKLRKDFSRKSPPTTCGSDSATSVSGTESATNRMSWRETKKPNSSTPIPCFPRLTNPWSQSPSSPRSWSESRPPLSPNACRR